MVRPYSEATASEVDMEVKRIADECFADAMRLLTEHRSQLDSLARAVLKDDSLDEEQILAATGIQRQTPAGGGENGATQAAASVSAKAP
jgi:cell division protease FtsH